MQIKNIKSILSTLLWVLLCLQCGFIETVYVTSLNENWKVFKHWLKFLKPFMCSKCSSISFIFTALPQRLAQHHGKRHWKWWEDLPIRSTTMTKMNFLNHLQILAIHTIVIPVKMEEHLEHIIHMMLNMLRYKCMSNCILHRYQQFSLHIPFVL